MAALHCYRRVFRLLVSTPAKVAVLNLVVAEIEIRPFEVTEKCQPIDGFRVVQKAAVRHNRVTLQTFPRSVGPLGHHDTSYAGESNL